MKHILAPEFALIGEIEGRPVGFALAIPDINRALKPAGGNLFIRAPQDSVLPAKDQESPREWRWASSRVRTAGVAAAFMRL